MYRDFQKRGSPARKIGPKKGVLGGLIRQQIGRPNEDPKKFFTIIRGAKIVWRGLKEGGEEEKRRRRTRRGEEGDQRRGGRLERGLERLGG